MTMARPSAFTVKVDVTAVTHLADKLVRMTPERMGALLVDAVNETAVSAYELSRKAILRGINLTDSYVQEHMRVERATTNNPVATITVLGGKPHITGLSHYGAMQETQPVAQPKRSKGDTKRGIPAGQKAAGVSVEVVRGRRKHIEHGFTLPGRQDRDDNPLVFTRNKSGTIKSRLGPSVYQLFRVAGEAIESQVYADLEQAVRNAAETQFAREFQ